MTLFFFILVILSISGFLFYRDRQYLNKNAKDVVSDEMKKILNVPTKDDTFAKNLQEPKSERTSQKILKEFN